MTTIQTKQQSQVTGRDPNPETDFFWEWYVHNSAMEYYRYAIEKALETHNTQMDHSKNICYISEDIQKQALAVLQEQFEIFIKNENLTYFVKQLPEDLRRILERIAFSGNHVFENHGTIQKLQTGIKAVLWDWYHIGEMYENTVSYKSSYTSQIQETRISIEWFFDSTTQKRNITIQIEHAGNVYHFAG